MLTFRNVFALGLFLFGTTFVWMTASFTGKTPAPDGAAWTLENVLALASIAVFSVAAWGVYKELPWWETATIVAGLIGILAVVPYVVAVSQTDGFDDGGVQINLAMHGIGSAIVLALMLLPAANAWVTRSL